MHINTETDTPGVCVVPIPPLSLSVEITLFPVHILDDTSNKEKSMDIQHTVSMYLAMGH